MSDFESTAAAAVSCLTEVEQMVNELESQFVEHLEQRQSVREQFQAAGNALSELLDQVSAGIEAARAQQQEKAQALEDQLAHLLQQAGEIQRGTAEAATQWSDDLGRFQASVTEADEGFRAGAESALNAGNDLQAELDSANQQAQSTAQEVQDALSSAGDTISEHAEAAGQHGQEWSELYATAFEPALDDNAAAAAEMLQDLKTQFEEAYSQAREQFEQTANDVTQSAQEHVEGLVGSLTTNVESMVESLATAGELASTSGETLITAKETMSTAMQTTTAGLQLAVGILYDIKEVLEKVA